MTARPGVSESMAASESVTGRPSVHAPLGVALRALGQARPDVVGLTADLAKYTDILPFAEAFPERFFNVGMAEQNMIAMAAGLAKTGLVPYCTTYGVFATRRAYDFVAIACAHSRLKVRIFAGLPGLTTSYGGTHQAIEDLALMRAVPGLTVIDPCDATELQQIVPAIVDVEGPVYVRLVRGTVPVVLDPARYRFEVGKARLLRHGRDVGLVSTGFMTDRAMQVAERLAGQSVDAAVLHVPTLKPFDAEAVVQLAHGVDRLVSIENHVTTGGLGSAVAETLVEHRVPRPLTRLGLPDQWLECGSVASLQDKYGLTVDRLAETVRLLA
jgi:transketolase